MYCIANLEPALSPSKIFFKCTPDKFDELVEIEGIIPAPYMARNHWVTIVEMNALRQPEIKELIRTSYELVMEKLPKKLQAELNGTAQPPVSRTKRKPAAKRRR
jgi:predicted DNA-binding protein (MmcQ/YjbR family)